MTGAPVRKKLENLTVYQLKNECRNQGLLVTGNKEQLIQRLYLNRVKIKKKLSQSDGASSSREFKNMMQGNATPGGRNSGQNRAYKNNHDVFFDEGSDGDFEIPDDYFSPDEEILPQPRVNHSTSSSNSKSKRKKKIVKKKKVKKKGSSKTSDKSSSNQRPSEEYNLSDEGDFGYFSVGSENDADGGEKDAYLLNREKLARLTTYELKEECRAQGLVVSGNKESLVTRLSAFLAKTPVSDESALLARKAQKKSKDKRNDFARTRTGKLRRFTKKRSMGDGFVDISDYEISDQEADVFVNRKKKKAKTKTKSPKKSSQKKTKKTKAKKTKSVKVKQEKVKQVKVKRDPDADEYRPGQDGSDGESDIDDDFMSDEEKKGKSATPDSKIDISKVAPPSPPVTRKKKQSQKESNSPPKKVTTRKSPRRSSSNVLQTFPPPPPLTTRGKSKSPAKKEVKYATKSPVKKESKAAKSQKSQKKTLPPTLEHVKPPPDPKPRRSIRLVGSTDEHSKKCASKGVTGKRGKSTINSKKKTKKQKTK